MNEQMQLQIMQLVLAAMQGDTKALLQIQQIMQAAQLGDLEAGLIALLIQQIAQQMLGGLPQQARRGAKLNYLKKLQMQCPAGTQLSYFKAGGKVCAKCEALKAARQLNSKVKMAKGGISKTVNAFKTAYKNKK